MPDVFFGSQNFVNTSYYPTRSLSGASSLDTLTSNSPFSVSTTPSDLTFPLLGSFPATACRSSACLAPLNPRPIDQQSVSLAHRADPIVQIVDLSKDSDPEVRV